MRKIWPHLPEKLVFVLSNSNVLGFPPLHRDTIQSQLVLVKHFQSVSWDNVTYAPDCWRNGRCKQTTSSKQLGAIPLKLSYVFQPDTDHSANNRNSLSQLETNVCEDMECEGLHLTVSRLL